MYKINYWDIEFSKLEQIDFQGTKSRIYHDKYKCYKIFRDLSLYEKKVLLAKFNNMKKLNLNSVIVPQEFIMRGQELVGYTMDYFNNSSNLYDAFTKNRYIDVNKILNITKKLSIILRENHNKGVMLQDFSFDNVLINNKGDIKICDIDGCCYGGIRSPYVSALIYNYYCVYKNSYPIFNESLDNISLLLSMIVSIYHKNLYELSINEYDELSYKINSLKALREIVRKLINKEDIEVPYLDTYIFDNDNYIIDRNKQVSLVNKIKRDYSIK